MRFEASIDVAAPAERVFGVYTDVEHWPDWTRSVTSIERLDQGPLRVGSRARIKQPRLPVAVWEVTDLVPGRSFTWMARGPGTVTTGSHVITPAGSGDRVKVTASLEQTGVLGPLLGLLTKRITNRYLDMEVRGLKAHGET
ncbi:MAG TPA: SRPBCC family protein [Jiangellaceae bacterium]|nr:SRPBCC family protein [Jiangellaceae bacterium]